MNIIETAVTAFIDRKLAQPASAAAPPVVGHSLAKGIAAGLVGGIAGTAAKVLCERVYPPRVHGEPTPTVVLAEKAAGHELAPVPKAAAAEAIHWGFGATVGAAYGAIAEYFPAATSRDGVNFGMTLMALTHESALPAMGLSAPPPAQTSREKTSEIASHVVYGLVTELTRRLVRKAL